MLETRGDKNRFFLIDIGREINIPNGPLTGSETLSASYMGDPSSPERERLLQVGDIMLNDLLNSNGDAWTWHRLHGWCGGSDGMEWNGTGGIIWA